MRRLLLVAMIALLGLGIGLVAWDPTGPYSQFCTLEGLLVETPTDWELVKDHHNDCAWTLLNENGERAPAELYAGMPIEPPPDYPNDWDALGWALIVVGSIGAGTASLQTRHPKPTQSVPIRADTAHSAEGSLLQQDRWSDSLLGFECCDAVDQVECQCLDVFGSAHLDFQTP